ncbi:MAG: signal peptidase II [Actinomycetota bacterium]
MKIRRYFILVSTGIFGLDLATKNWAETYLRYSPDIKLIGDFLKLSYSTNSGAAFNFLTEATFILSTLKFVVAGLLIYLVRQVTSLRWAIAMALLLGGVLGNLFDRVFRSPGIWRGEVIDWIELPNWPTFNIADSAIVIAGIGLAALATFNVPFRDDRGNHESDGVKK